MDQRLRSGSIVASLIIHELLIALYFYQAVNILKQCNLHTFQALLTSTLVNIRGGLCLVQGQQLLHQFSTPRFHMASS